MEVRETTRIYGNPVDLEDNFSFEVFGKQKPEPVTSHFRGGYPEGTIIIVKQDKPEKRCTATASNCFDKEPVVIEEYDPVKQFINSQKDAEFRKYKNYLDCREEIAKIKTDEAIEYIKDFPLKEDNFAFELTPKPSAVFTIVIDNNTIFCIELYFENVKQDEEVFFGIFKDKKCVANGIGSMQDVFDDLCSYLGRLR